MCKEFVADCVLVVNVQSFQYETQPAHQVITGVFAVTGRDGQSVQRGGGTVLASTSRAAGVTQGANSVDKEHAD